MKKNLLIFLLLFFPIVSDAQITITEVMYDVEGSDSGREWVEIYNSGVEDIDITDWWFFDGSNHGFQNESAVLAGNAYAVVVDNLEKFTADWPDINALILDSSAFSLKNTGEYIAIKDIDKNEVDGLSFAPFGLPNTTPFLLFVSSPAFTRSLIPILYNANAAKCLKKLMPSIRDALLRPAWRSLKTYGTSITLGLCILTNISSPIL